MKHDTSNLVLQNIDIAGIFCNTASSTFILQNIDIARLVVLQNTDIAGHVCITEYRYCGVHNTGSSTFVLQNIDIAGLVHTMEYCRACSYYRIQILQGTFVLQNIDIAGLVCIIKCRYISYIYTIVYQGSLKTVVTAGGWPEFWGRGACRATY